MPQGTRVTFRPDPEIFKSTVEFDFDKVALRMDELAYLNAGLSILMRDFRKPVATGAAAVAMKAAADLTTQPEKKPV
jgi:DNA gyrase/topoisomerase IV subunit B